jgi:hypothetical protein
MTQMIRKHFLLPLPLDERIKLVARGIIPLTPHRRASILLREALIIF